MDYDSESDSEDVLVEKLRLLSSEVTPDEKGYDVYLNQHLPLLGVHRSYAGQKESKEYKIGLLHYLESPEHGADPEESVLSAFADRPIPESLGCLEHTGRTPGFEISSKLLDCSLNKSSSPGISNSLHFELLQRDVIDVRLNSGCTASGFLFQPIVSCDSSSPKQLQAVTVHLSLPESEGCRFLGVEDAPSGAECVAAYDVGGRVIFSRAQYADNVPCKVLYVGHETAGTASSCMVDSAKAEMELRAPSGRQIVKQLSGQLLACIEDEDKTSYSMRVSVEVTAVEVRPHSRMPLFSRQLSFRSKEPAEKVYVLDKEVQICS